MAQKYVTNFDVGTENILIRDSNVMHGEGLINVKFPPDTLSPLKGDGSNETTGLQNMINYAISENMALFFPEGVYAVDSINVSGKVTFIGSNAIIRKIVSSATPVINATGFLTMRGIGVDGNISVLTAAVVGLNVKNAGFDIADCSFTGCSDCIHADINTPSKLYNCICETFNEYGIFLNGTSYINAFGISMNVQANTAMRFMKLDNSNNIIYGLESMSEVPIGVEITGDFNYISARIPNCENPVSDSGQNNNFEIIDQLSKRTYQNLMMQVSGDYTQTVGDFDGTATGHYSFSGEDVILNPSNPLTYKIPTELSDYFDTIKFKTPAGMMYDVLVATENTPKLKEYSEPFSSIFNVVEYGAKKDGSEDCSGIINSIISDHEGGTILFPEGEYLLDEPITINKPFNVIGTSAYMDFQSGLHGSIIKFSGNRAFEIAYCGIQISTLCITSTTPLTGDAITFNDNTTSQSGSTINCTIRDVYIYNVNVGILQQVSTVFKTILEKVWVNTCNTGIFFTRGTSITLLNCWVTWAHNAGYNITELTYSSLINCACDNCYTIGYNIVNCNNIDILSCGCETTPVVAEDPPTAPAFFVQGSNLVHINVSFVNCRGLTGDQTAILVLTGSEQCIIDRCWIAGERATTWFIFDNNGKNNVMFNTRNDVNNTFQARLNGEDVSLSQIITTKDAS